MQERVRSEVVPIYSQLSSNPSLLGLVYYQAILELDNIPEIDVDAHQHLFRRD